MIFFLFEQSETSNQINECFSERSRIEHGVPQGSILGPLVFNIDLTHLLYECEESNIASYADNTTPYSCPRDSQTVISELKSICSKLFHWFQYNHLKVNPEKYHLLLGSETPTDYLLVMLQLKLAQKKPYLESSLIQNSVLTNKFLPFVVKLARNYML